MSAGGGERYNIFAAESDPELKKKERKMPKWSKGITRVTYTGFKRFRGI